MVTESDLIKYSSDFVIPVKCKWRATKVRKLLGLSQRKKQKELQVCHPARSRHTEGKKEIIKVLGQCKSSPNGPLTSAEELYSFNKCTLPQAALHTDMNLDIRFRTLTVIAIKGVCALFQQKNTTVENRVRSLTSLISLQLGLSASAEIDN